jgi:beta-phosphoglucomutase
MAQELGRPFTRADFAATFGRRNPEIIRQLFAHPFTDGEIADLGFRKEELYKSLARQGVELLPGVRALLEGLNETGARQAIGSSAPRGNVDLILELTQTKRCFAAAVAMEDTERGKPDPQVFLLAAEWLGVPPERCIVLEDAVAGVQAAKAGGMACIAVRFVGHHSEDHLRAAGADLIVPTLELVTARTVQDLLKAGAA